MAGTEIVDGVLVRLGQIPGAIQHDPVRIGIFGQKPGEFVGFDQPVAHGAHRSMPGRRGVSIQLSPAMIPPSMTMFWPVM